MPKVDTRYGLYRIDPGYWLELGFENKNPAIKSLSIIAKAFVPSFFSRKWSDGPTVMFLMTALETGLLVTSGATLYLCARAFFLAEEAMADRLRF